MASQSTYLKQPSLEVYQNASLPLFRQLQKSYVSQEIFLNRPKEWLPLLYYPQESAKVLRGTTLGANLTGLHFPRPPVSCMLDIKQCGQTLRGSHDPCSLVFTPFPNPFPLSVGL